MASPGWYPDPAGQPGAFRFWDGGAWSAELADNPYGPPPGQAPAPPAYPTQPGQPAQPSQPTDPQGYQSYAGAGGTMPPPPPPPGVGGWGATPQPAPQQPWSPQPSAGSRRGPVVVLVAVVAVIVLAVATFFVVEALTDDDSSTSGGSGIPGATATARSEDPSTAPGAEPSTAPSTAPSTGSDTQPGESPSADPTTPSPTGLQCTGGLPMQGAAPVQGGVITGGGLQMPTVKGFEVDPAQGAGYVFADGAVVAGKIIEQVDSRGWVAQHVLAGLNRANGFDSPQQAAETVLTCLTASDDFYASYTGTDMVDSAATTVGDADAWRLTANVNIDDPELTVTGDVVTIVVVDTGDADTFGLYVSVVPIGDNALIAQQTAQVGKLALQ